MKLEVKVDGLEDVMDKFKNQASDAAKNVDNVTETYTRKMANESSSNAPVLTGDLRASIAASPRKLSEGLWEYGSDLEYARIQEYEHHTYYAFIRNSVWNNEQPYKDAAKREVLKE